MPKGTLLAESLRIGAALDVAGLRVTRPTRRDVSASVSAAQAVRLAVPGLRADDLADPLAQSPADTLLDDGGWYTDFTVGDVHMVVFADKIFRYRRCDQSGRATAADYGRTVGVPDHRLDWTD
ncbi:hypothetical protein OG417_07975 [Actinoallomurus sp. NBC_01490]|jgi:hypothetical protein|uniref:hypothetical protein n=1 Tax=Actinoallomurus sp. NBC_01490 TaxID=2903557 RepID=UPI002E37B41B|nr:hypothetical protein [Actinoallomurus sp. NBC_01490]